MPTSGAGAIGSMSVPVEERKKLAIRYALNIHILLVIHMAELISFGFSVLKLTRAIFAAQRNTYFSL